MFERINLIYSDKDMLNDDYAFNLEVITFEEVLHRYLQKEGYKKILFYNGSDGIYVYDYNSLQRRRKKRRISSLMKKEEEKDEIKLQRSLIESEMIKYVETFFKNNEKVAFIFTDIFSLLNNLNQEELKELNQLILDIKQLPAYNENRLFFLEPSSSNITLIKDRLLHFRGIDNLTTTFFVNLDKKDLHLKKGVFNIESAFEDEVRDLLNHLRIKYKKETNFLEFDDLVTEITRKIKQDNLSLKDVHRKVYHKNINFEDLKSEFNIKKESAWEKLDKLVGFSEVKEELKKIVNYLKNKKEEKKEKSEFVKRIIKSKPAKEKKEDLLNLNFILTGNPGTGKTTLASIIAEIFKEEAILPYGQFIKTSRSDLVAGYVGQTAIKTKETINRAIGGVLFIDEAYALNKDSEGDFGEEAIDELVAALPSPEFSCIIAGYKDDMKKFLKTNEGLERRFKNSIHLRDYNDKELKEIFLRLVKDIKLDKELEEILDEFFENAYKSGFTRKHNAAFSVNLFKDMDKNRVFNGRKELKIEDIPEKYNKFLPPKYQKFEISNEVLKEIESLVGLKEVKDAIRSLVNEIKYAKMVNEPIKIGHFVFKGNPGTGKTTVARLIGKILKEFNLLEGEFIEAKISDLVAEAVGQTGPKTQKVIEEAMGGVLFIDEAYGLVNRGDFGKEALEILIQEMENRRGEFVAILAGYSNEMEELFNLNPGLKSRVDNIFEFEDYNLDELMQIFDYLLEKEGFTITQKAREKVYYYFQNILDTKDKHFGNARFVRQFFKEILKNLKTRVVETKPSNLKEIIEEDIILIEN